MSDLLHPDPRRRRRAVRDASGFALRRILAADPDATVRAAAADALGRASGEVRWLIDALRDVSPIVRDAAIRSLARRRAVTLPLAELVAGDPVWWVRRAAVYALGAIGQGDVAPIRAALGDPFWRVRHAAVQVLAAMGDRNPAIRPEILAGAIGSGADWLRSSWGPTLLQRSDAIRVSALPEALRDPDPAVVTKRLAAIDPPPLALVELLCDPHEPLRRLAASKLARTGDAEAFVAALAWLDEPRIPHVVATVTGMLDGLGDPARELAERLLSGRARPGALRWAIGWVVATHDRALGPLAVARAAELGEPARALAFAAPATLVSVLGSPEAIAAAVELTRRPSGTVRVVLDAVRDHPSAEVRSYLLVAARAIGDTARLEAALTDPDAGPRAVAVRSLADQGQLSPQARTAALADPDPAVREAAIDANVAPEVLADLLANETDPWVRRAASRLGNADQTDLAAVLTAAADPEASVRAAAIERLLAVPDAAIRAVVDDLAPAGRAAAIAWLAAADPVPVAVVTPTAPRQRPVPMPIAAVARRGRLGLPALVVSGAFDLAPGSLHVALAAGADAFFWESTYAAMTRFLRAPGQRHRARVITGTYHADAASITRDAERALRRLRRDTLDVYLLFWTRSAARLDDEAIAALDRLKQSGKVRAVGFSTHDRALAAAAIGRSSWDVVMIRHSAAHPGIETDLLPTAGDTDVLTFSALCYGRMLGGDDPPSATDCYRYSLAQPGVTACLTAPRRHRELVENLEALTAPRLDEAAVARLRAHGARIHADNGRFNALIRQPTRDAAAAAMAMLESELPPEDACAAPDAVGRSTGSRGRGRASLQPATLRRGRL